MKKLLTMAGVALMLTMAMATTAMAAEYNIDGPEDPLFASPTSVDQVTVVDGGVTEQSNIDRSKNAAVVPPPFGSPESYQTGSGAVLIPQTQTQTSGSATTPIGGGTAYYPPAESVTPPASNGGIRPSAGLRGRCPGPDECVQHRRQQLCQAP